MLNLPVFMGKKTPNTFRCYQMKRSTDAWKRCITCHLISPKYSVIVAENGGFSWRNFWDFFHADLRLFAIFCQASRYNSDVTRIARTGLGTKLQCKRPIISPPGFPVQLLTSFPLFLPFPSLNAHCTFSSVGYLQHSLHPLGGCDNNYALYSGCSEDSPGRQLQCCPFEMDHHLPQQLHTTLPFPH